MPDPLSIEPAPQAPDFPPGVTHVIQQRRMARLLAFAGRSIDDVVNCGVSKRLVAGYFKLDLAVSRRTEVLELEGQWNPLGRRREWSSVSR